MILSGMILLILLISLVGLTRADPKHTTHPGPKHPSLTHRNLSYDSLNHTTSSRKSKESKITKKPSHSNSLVDYLHSIAKRIEKYDGYLPKDISDTRNRKSGIIGSTAEEVMTKFYAPTAIENKPKGKVWWYEYRRYEHDIIGLDCNVQYMCLRLAFDEKGKVIEEDIFVEPKNVVKPKNNSIK